MTLFLLLNPKHYDNSDPTGEADVWRKRKKQREKEEEELAVALLLEQYKKQQKAEPERIDFEKLLTGALQANYYGMTAERQMRIKQLFLIMLLDDD
jgi:hypothetical protein